MNLAGGSVRPGGAAIEAQELENDPNWVTTPLFMSEPTLLAVSEAESVARLAFKQDLEVRTQVFDWMSCPY